MKKTIDTNFQKISRGSHYHLNNHHNLITALQLHPGHNSAVAPQSSTPQLPGHNSAVAPQSHSVTATVAPQLNSPAPRPQFSSGSPEPQCNSYRGSPAPRPQFSSGYPEPQCTSYSGSQTQLPSSKAPQSHSGFPYSSIPTMVGPPLY